MLWPGVWGCMPEEPCRSWRPQARAGDAPPGDSSCVTPDSPTTAAYVHALSIAATRSSKQPTAQLGKRFRLEFPRLTGRAIGHLGRSIRRQQTRHCVEHLARTARKPLRPGASPRIAIHRMRCLAASQPTWCARRPRASFPPPGHTCASNCMPGTGVGSSWARCWLAARQSCRVTPPLLTHNLWLPPKSDHRRPTTSRRQIQGPGTALRRLGGSVSPRQAAARQRRRRHSQQRRPAALRRLVRRRRPGAAPTHRLPRPVRRPAGAWAAWQPDASALPSAACRLRSRRAPLAVRALLCGRGGRSRRRPSCPPAATRPAGSRRRRARHTGRAAAAASFRAAAHCRNAAGGLAGRRVGAAERAARLGGPGAGAGCAGGCGLVGPPGSPGASRGHGPGGG